METSVKLHLTVRSLISSSFATCGKELLLTCASSGNREEWIHSSRALAAPLPKLYPEPVQVSMLAGIVQATKVSLKFLCSLHTRTNARSCRTTVVFEYRAITLRVFKRSTKIDCFPIIDDNFEIVLLDQKSKRRTCAKD